MIEIGATSGIVPSEEGVGGGPEEWALERHSEPVEVNHR